MRTMSPKAKPSGGSTLPQVSKDLARAFPLRSSCWQAAFGRLPAVYRTTGQVRTGNVRDRCDLRSPRHLGGVGRRRRPYLYWLVFQRLWNFTDRQRRVHQVTLDHDLLRCQCRRPDLGRMLETSQATHEALVPATAGAQTRSSEQQSERGDAGQGGSLGSSSAPTRRGTGSRFPSPAATATEAAKGAEQLRPANRPNLPRGRWG